MPSHPARASAAPTYRSWQPGIIPLRPLSFGDFLSVPFKAMRYNRAVILGAPLLFTVASTVLVLVTLWVVFTDPQLGLMNPNPPLSGISGMSITLIAVSIAGALLADVFSSSIIAPGVARAVLGERIGIGTAWKQVRRRLGSLLLLYLVTTTIFVVIVGIAVTLLVVTDASPSAIVGAVLLMLALIPIGIVVGVFQGVARAMIVLEGIPMVAALRRLMRLITGRFWWSLLIVFVAAVLINVAASILQYVGQFAALAVTLFAPENLLVFAIALFVVYGVAYVISLVMVYAYLGSTFALIYIDLRMRREGFDLELARAAEARAHG